MKTKTRPERTRTINIVGCDAVLYERIRASLRRSPFIFLASTVPLPPDEVAMYVVHAPAVDTLPGTGIPVIAWGPSGLLRGAFLAGCDDYLREPWTPEELAARTHAVLSRAQRRFSFPWGDAALEGDTLVVPGALASFTRQEALILRALLRSRGQPVPRDALALVAGGGARAAGSRVIDAHVAALRRKVRAVAPAAGRFIICVRRQGYMIP